jgi:hypothetical protein
MSYYFFKRHYVESGEKWCCVCCICRVCDYPNCLLLLEKYFVDVCLRCAAVDVGAIEQVGMKEAYV